MAFPCHLQTLTLGNHSITLYIPDAAAVQQAYRHGQIPFPYWSKVWPAAEALAHFIHQHPEYITGKKLVELGAGLGLPSLVAAQRAATVLCTDYEPEAIKLAEQSALHLALTSFSTAVIDWRHIPENIKADVWLLSDMNYEPSLFEVLLKTIQGLMADGATIVLSTPQRLMAKDFIKPLHDYCTHRNELIVRHEGKDVMITVMVLKA